MNIKGNLPLLILYLLSNRDSHGYAIARDIKQRSEGLLNFKEGTLYPTLHLLEHEGYIESYRVEERGRLRRYYRLTESGYSHMHEQMSAWEHYTRAVNRVLQREGV
jgi:PadR family transcriptional regulator, regulatory protein PadR